MENIKLEQLDLIMQRANVSYSEAKEALEQANGDVVEALLYLERNNKIKSQAQGTCSSSDAVKQCKGFIHKLNATQFVLSKQNKSVVTLPLSIALLVLIFAFPLTVACLLIALLCGMNINIKGDTSIADKFNEAFDMNSLNK